MSGAAKALQIPPWDSDQSHLAIRVQDPSGSCNACWRREPGGGNTDPPEADNLRVSTQTVEREKLNDERGVKPLPVSRNRDGAESGNACPGWVRGRFCILALEIISRLRDGNYAGAGASDIPGKRGHNVRPT